MIRTVILCLGDSLTYGARDIPEGYGYPPRLAQYYYDKFQIPCIAVNKGISRETSSDVLRRSYDVCRAYPEAHILCLLMGTNDLKSPDIGLFEHNLKHLFWIAGTCRKKVIVGTLPPVIPSIMPCFPSDVECYREEYNEAIRSAAFKNKAVVVDFSDMENYLVDGVHFGPEGYAAMAMRWTDAMD